MKRIAVINVVGLSESVIGESTPFIKSFIERNTLRKIEPVLPALTTSAQTTYLTGVFPDQHGIVGNGWYDHEDSEIKFWKQSNKLVQAESIWDSARKINPKFTCAQLFWWYNMYNNVDFSITPRPNYLADGRKMPDCYAYPATLRDELQEKFGQFPLFSFWGPGANIKSSKWIADASMYVEEKNSPTLNLVYLPHLDYCLQKFGPDRKLIDKELREIDELLQTLVGFYESRDVEVMLISEYGIAPVNNPIHLNRILRQEELLSIRKERGLELLDAGASEAFAVADHQIAHIYTKSQTTTDKIKAVLKGIKGIDKVLDKEEQKNYNLWHKRSGDLVILADRESWFSYYFWFNDKLAPDYARMVDIHKKPGYDPVEMFMTSKARAMYKVLKKKLGFRYTLDVIPLDANLVKGSHGIVDVEEQYFPILIAKDLSGNSIKPTQIKSEILKRIFRDSGN